MKYAEALKNVVDEEPAAQGYSRGELMRRIEAIGQQLKGPMPNVERILLCGDRTAYQKALAALDATP